MTTSALLHRPPRRTPAAPVRPDSTPAVPSTVGAADPAWARPALLVLLALTALAYLWDLSASGYANSFYAAAVQAGTKSWKAFFFGSLDSSNFITVDKPPASLWVMALSGRIFGFSSWSMLVPQALEGVAAVGLLYAAVKRWFGAGAGLAAGAVFALTPVAALMFRFNNPDALLVLLLVAAAYCMVRALERAGTRWILAAGALIGFAFLAKMMQAFLVLPAFALVYLVAAPTTLRRRLGQLLAGGVADRAQRRLVGRDRRALARRLAAVHRRLARQQHPQPDLRLQRPRAPLRQQWTRRPGRWRRRWRRQLQRRHRPAAPVQRPDGRPGLVAAAGRAARARRRPVGEPPRAAHRPHARRAAAVGRLAARHRRRLQLRPGRDPHLLHRRARARDRRARRDRRRAVLVAPRDRSPRA